MPSSPVSLTMPAATASVPSDDFASSVQRAAVQKLSTPALAAEPACPGVTLRVALLCLVLAGMFGYLIPLIDYKLFNTFLGATHLPPGAIAVLLMLVLVVNPLLRLLSRAWAFTRNELLTVYITCLFSCLVPGHGGENFIIPNLVAPFYFAKRENGWMDFLRPYLTPWLTPALDSHRHLNREVYTDFYQGLATGHAIPWAYWMVPLIFWGSFALASYWMLGCLSVMLRAQWGENEALTFPLLKLPIALTEGMSESRGGNAPALPPLFRNGAMWSGFGIAAFIQLANGLHLYFPDVPQINLWVDTGPLLSEPPWNQLGWVPLGIFPIALGIAYLLTTEASFSLWFFFWFMKFQGVAAYYAGFPPSSLPTATGAFNDRLFAGYQQGGACLAYTLLILWAARHHFKHVVQRAFGRTGAKNTEQHEVLSYPIAFWGFVGSFGYLVVATCAAGVRADIAFALWLTYLVAAITLTRVAVEGGLLQLLYTSTPLGAVARLLNSGPSLWLTPENGLVSVAVFQSGFVYHMRAFLMPSFLQSFKLAYDRKINGRRLALLLGSVIVLTLGVSWWQILRLTYTTGGLQMGHRWYMQGGSLNSMNFVKAMTQSDNAPAWQHWLWLGVGMMLTWGMFVARSRLMWFPFHPIGYLVALTYPTYMFWFSIFLGWLAKSLISRFGGAEGVRRATPFFLGLALGDVAMMIVWLVVDGWQGRVGHLLMPG